LSTPVVRIGWPDQFIEHGKPDALRAKYGISVEAILEKLGRLLRCGADTLVRESHLR
jgi:1-deoxy-D-xylulose-5-phosphate synthase